MNTNPDVLYTLVKLRHAEQLTRSREYCRLIASTCPQGSPLIRVFWHKPWSRLRHLLRRDPLGTAGR